MVSITLFFCRYHKFMQHSVVYYKSVTSLFGLPKDGKPQIAVCGRSNVGKSSLINAIFNKKSLAKVSQTPGKTRMLNFFLVDEKYYLVDLPGFGFAKVSKEEQEKWAAFINEYFRSDAPIVLVLHLVDSRHEPGVLDISFDRYVQSGGLISVKVLTKTDKLKQNEKKKNAGLIKKAFDATGDHTYILTSSETGEGLKELRTLISVTADAVKG